jgi:hypothetical protein
MKTRRPYVVSELKNSTESRKLRGFSVTARLSHYLPDRWSGSAITRRLQ